MPSGAVIELDLSVEIDVVATRARLVKELAAAEKELTQNEAKLANPAFADKAPEPVIAKVRDRLAAAGPTSPGSRRRSPRWAVTNDDAEQRRPRRRAARAVEAALVGRWGEGRIHPTRARIEALMDVLGEPQRAYRSIHLTGTNGKTSTARMIDELLRAFGLRTGRYTSPHLTRINERIVVDGEPISDRTLVEAYAEIAPFVDLVDKQFEDPSNGELTGIKLSFFEVMTGLAYAIFADAPVDVAVVEVGLGGEWDATNVIDAEIAVVTPIGLDHTQYLGPTTGAIAAEKAGIIKRDSIAILASSAQRRGRRAAATLDRGGRQCGPRGARVRRARSAAGRRRPGADPAGSGRCVRGGLPAALRRPPGPERRLRAGRGRGVLRRRLGERAHRRRHRARGVRSRSARPGGSRRSARRRP